MPTIITVHVNCICMSYWYLYSYTTLWEAMPFTKEETLRKPSERYPVMPASCLNGKFVERFTVQKAMAYPASSKGSVACMLQEYVKPFAGCLKVWLTGKPIEVTVRQE